MKLQKVFGFLGIIAVTAAMTTACAQTDAGISTSVKSRLAADDTVKAYRIDVDTKDKVVTLRGEVDTPAAKDSGGRDCTRNLWRARRRRRAEGGAGGGRDEWCRRQRPRRGPRRRQHDR